MLRWPMKCKSCSCVVEIASDAQAEIGKSQRDYVLRQQLKAIQQELGEGDSDSSELAHLKEQIEHADLPDRFVKKPTVSWRDSIKRRRPRRSIRSFETIWSWYWNCRGRRPRPIRWTWRACDRCWTKIITAFKRSRSGLLNIWPS